MDGNSIVVKDLVLLGGGHAHVHVIKMFGMKPIKGLRVTVITRDVDTPYSGMIPGYVAGYYTKEECHIDLRRLCSFAQATLIHATANKLDIEKKLIYLADGRPPIKFDILSIDVGITPKPLPNHLALISDCLTPVKPIDSFSIRWNQILNRVLNRDHDVIQKIAIVGGGAGGTELAFSIQYRLITELQKRNKDPSTIKMMLVNRSDRVLPTHNSSMQAIAHRLLIEKGIEVVLNAEVIDAAIESNNNNNNNNDNDNNGSSNTTSRKFLITADGRRLEFDEAIWCIEAAAQSWLHDAGLATNEDGFVCVHNTLESTNTPGIFACGDIAHLVENPRPKAGVFAVRAGPPLVENLRRKIFNQTLEPWTPQKDFLGILCCGGAYAIASKGPIAMEGEYLWKLKDKIDRTFMNNYQHFAEIENMELMMANKKSSETLEIKSQETVELLKKSKMRCGGCGSKVGSQILDRVLKRVKQYKCHRSEVILGVGDDAALVKAPNEDNAVLVHTIDYFRSFISDPFVFGQIAANHALSDIFAMNADPVSALALCVLPYGAETKVEESLVQMLSGVMTVLTKEHCALVGGHTSEGHDCSIGLSVNGVLPSIKQGLLKGPPNLGDVIILTKAIGTGTILAADMRAKAKAAWMQSAIDSMLQSNRDAAKILYQNGCTACTDVTGFGLAGHLLEMIRTSVKEDEQDDLSDSHPTIGASISINQIPMLLGAIECIQSGVLSSLHPQNIRSAQAIANVYEVESSPRYPLLFDPQTSGGLIAAVPSEMSDFTVRALRDAGYHSTAVIGRIVSRSDLPEDYTLTLSLE